MMSDPDVGAHAPDQRSNLTALHEVKQKCCSRWNCSQKLHLETPTFSKNYFIYIKLFLHRDSENSQFEINLITVVIYVRKLNNARVEWVFILVFDTILRKVYGNIKDTFQGKVAQASRTHARFSWLTSHLTFIKWFLYTIKVCGQVPFCFYQPCELKTKTTAIALFWLTTFLTTSVHFSHLLRLHMKIPLEQGVKQRRCTHPRVVIEHFLWRLLPKTVSRGYSVW